MNNIASHNTRQTAEHLRDLVVSGVTKYPRLCLRAQREARGNIPAVYPTALSASNATPKSERVYDRKDFERGMVGFSYDPRIPGTAGHVFFIAGINQKGRILTCTNDAYELGAMDYVPIEFYEEQWGQTIQFAATWLNGYDFKDFEKPPQPVFAGNLGDQYREAMKLLIKVRQRKLEKYGPTHPLVIALDRDVERMKRKLAKWGRD